MNFNNAEVLSYTHKSDFFGGDVIRYRTTKQIEVQGNLLNLSSTSGVSGIISGIAALEVSSNDWVSAVINGIDFGSGIITNISFDQGNDVRIKKYTIALDIVETGSLNNLPTNDSYANISYNDYKFVDSLSESITLDRNFQKDVYNHSVDISVNSSNITGSIGLAKSIARNLFESNSFNAYIGNYYGISGKKSTYEESYDKIKGECSFNQTTDLFANQSGNYSIDKTFVYNRESNGVVTISEKGEIKATVEPYINVLTDAYKLESANSSSNCQEIFDSYKEADTYNLNLIAITKGTSISRYERTLSYEHVFSNDVSINDGYFWEYSHDSSLDENGTIQTTEQGSIIGRGHRIDTKYANANAGFDIVDNAINSRSLASYNRYRTFITIPSPSNFTLLKKSETYLKHIGQINYGWNYSNDSSLVVGDPYIIQNKITVSEQDQIPLTNSFNIFNYGEIEQSTNNYIISQVSVEVELRGKRDTTMDYYLTYAKNLASPYAKDFLTEASYSLSPFGNAFSLNVAWGKVYEPN